MAAIGLHEYSLWKGLTISTSLDLPIDLPRRSVCAFAVALTFAEPRYALEDIIVQPPLGIGDQTIYGIIQIGHV